MTHDYRIVTSDNVKVTFEVAELGTRCTAFLIDFLIQHISVGGIMFLLWGIERLTEIPVLSSDWSVVVLILGYFIMLWGYFIVFERLWNGRTPGKKRMGIRVMADNGHAVSTSDVVIRNIVRIIDQFIPIGIIVAFISPQRKRLGDYLAGTIVIKEKEFELKGPVKDMSTYNSFPVDIEGTVRSRIQRLTAQDLKITREYLTRREALEPNAAKRLATKLADGLLKKLSLDYTYDEPDKIIEAIYVIMEAEL